MATTAKLRPNSGVYNRYGSAVTEAAKQQIGLIDTENGLDLNMTSMLDRMDSINTKLPDDVDDRLTLSLMVQELSDTIQDAHSSYFEEGETPSKYTGGYDKDATKEVFDELGKDGSAYIPLPDENHNPNNFFKNAVVPIEQRRSILGGIADLDQGPQQYLLGELTNNPDLKNYADIDAQITKSLTHFDDTYNQISGREPINSLAVFKNGLTLEPPTPAVKNEAAPQVELPNNTATLSDDGELIINAVKNNKLNSALGLNEKALRDGLLAAEQKMPADTDDRIRLGLLHQELGNMASGAAKPEQDLKTPLFKVARDSYSNSPSVEDGFIAFIGKGRPSDNSPMSNNLSSDDRNVILDGLKPLTQPEKQYVGANLMDNPDIDFNQTVTLVEQSLKDFGAANAKIDPNSGINPADVFSEALNNAVQARTQQKTQGAANTMPTQSNLASSDYSGADMSPPDFSNIPMPDGADAYEGAPLDTELDLVDVPQPPENKAADKNKPKNDDQPSASAVAAAKIAEEGRLASEAKAQEAKTKELAAAGKPNENDALKNRSEVDILMKAVEENDFFSSNMDVGEIEDRLIAINKKLEPFNPSDSMRAAVFHQEMQTVADDVLKQMNNKPAQDGSELTVTDKLRNTSMKYRALDDIAKAHFADSHRLDDINSSKRLEGGFDGMSEEQANLLHKTISRIPNGVRQHALSELKTNLKEMPEHGFDDVIKSIKQSLSDFDTVNQAVNPQAKPQLKAFSEKLASATTASNKNSEKPIDLPEFKPTPLKLPNSSPAENENAQNDTPMPNQDEKLTDSNGKENDDKNPKKDPRLENDPDNPQQGGGTQTIVTYSLFNFKKPSHQETMQELQFSLQEKMAKTEAKEAAKAAKAEAKAAKAESTPAENADQPTAPNAELASGTAPVFNSDGTVTPSSRSAAIDSLAQLLDTPYEENPAPAPTVENPAPTVDDPESTVNSPAPNAAAPAVAAPKPLLESAPKPDFNDSVTENYYQGLQLDYAHLDQLIDVYEDTPEGRELITDHAEAFLYQVGAMAEHLDQTTSKADVDELKARSEGLDFIKQLKDDIETKAEKKGLFSDNDYDPMADTNNRSTHPLKEKFTEAEDQVKKTKEGLGVKSSALMAGLGAKISGLFTRKP